MEFAGSHEGHVRGEDTQREGENEFITDLSNTNVSVWIYLNNQIKPGIMLPSNNFVLLKKFNLLTCNPFCST